MTQFDVDVAAAIRAGDHELPHAYLGAHEQSDRTTVVRVLRPGAVSATLVAGPDRIEMDRLQDDGPGADFFLATLPYLDLIDYRIETVYPDGNVHGPVADGYRFLPTIGELDRHLFLEGRHERLWDVLGAHPRRYTTPDGIVDGVSFAVWAPHARGVVVTGDFDHWSGHSWPLRKLEDTGIWEVFVPDARPGARYHYLVRGADGDVRHKADPMAFATELPPGTASVVADTAPAGEEDPAFGSARFAWTDAAWTQRRAAADPRAAAMNIYEVHLGSWRPGLSYRELAVELVDYVVSQGFTHVELLPVAEHPYGGSWGYQVTSYYAPTARFGSPNDFRALVDAFHAAGIGVFMDWVPAHFPKDAWALARFDGTPLYEHSDPQRGEQLDWGTYIFDFGRPQVRNFLVSNAQYWIEEFHIDGLRVDAVASMLYLDYSRPDGGWTPNRFGGRENLEAVQFLQELNGTVAKNHPGTVMIAEESTAWPGVTRSTDEGGLGFTFKWNMGWMHDLLGYFVRDPLHRSYHHHDITFSLMYAWSEAFMLPISHDEVVHGKGTLFSRAPGDDGQKAAGVRALLAYMWSHPGKQLLFMGQEWGQATEWSEEHGLNWPDSTTPLHAGIARLVVDLNRLATTEPALHALDADPRGFEWIEADDARNSVLSFLRWGPDGEVVLCVANLSGAEIPNYALGAPRAGAWAEVLNTDAADYAGSGVGNFGRVTATNTPRHGQPASLELRLPASAVLWLVPQR